MTIDEYLVGMLGVTADLQELTDDNLTLSEMDTQAFGTALAYLLKIQVSFEELVTTFREANTKHFLH
jgi:hypothetical protein